MGYLTLYTLEASTPAIKYLRETSEEAACVLDKNGQPQEWGKWYEHEKEIRECSKLFPMVLFVLHCKGTDAGDIWKKYFRDGKMQSERAEMKIAEFDPKKLK